jgi:ubiquinone/menaquinone biosynthesis C-methylase UbiE
MHDTETDKLLELARYDARAQSLLFASGGGAAGEFGSSTMPEYLRSPYIFYEKCVSELIGSQDQVLELGAGSGLHTWALVQTGGRVTATDISPNSLKLLEQRIVNAGAGVKTQVADIESLPFADASFDVVACAGSLSYGEPSLVDAEIRRVLRPGGLLVCVDSLNHNPVYRVNRRLRYWRGARTKSTLRRMPDLSRIEALGNGFASVKVHYFGALTFAMPVLARLCGQKHARAMSDIVDRLIGAKRSAFKFVLIAKGLSKSL